MRYAVFSDVHANLEALQAVLDFFSGAHVNAYIFLGDIVGYGADPQACLSVLKTLRPLAVAGNHDWASVGRLDTDFFNAAARAAVAWTASRLTQDEHAFLADLELVKEGPDFYLVHGTLEAPERFDYMLDARRARRSFEMLDRRVCFVGHSHQPGVFIAHEGAIVYREAGEVDIEPEKRYIVNDGSVGQPRDGDPRACCCIYDDREGRLTFHRIPYDIKSAATKIRQAGLPPSRADRLFEGR